MFDPELTNWLLIGVWSLAAVGMGLLCGFFIGRSYTLTHEPKRLADDRDRTLTALMSLMESAEQLNEDVDTHNSELRSAKSDLEDISTEDSGQIGQLQSKLLSNIARVVQSNRKMENDLVVSKFQLERQAQELDRTRKEARTDGLCNVGNRLAFDEAIKFMVSRYVKEKKPFGLMLVDIDHFKRINDTFGHQVGDEVLTSIGRALNECVRPEDVVCRLGGDEFAILLEGLAPDDADIVGQRIRSTIELHDFSIGRGEDESTVVTMSMGLSVAKAGDTVESLYQRSDEALYKSKDLGRNRLFTMVDCQVIATANDEPEDELQSYEEFKALVQEGN